MKPILLYSAEKHSFPSEYPANFYGMTDNHVYILYKGSITKGDKVRNNCVLMRMEEFYYDYEKAKLFQLVNGEKIPVLSFASLADSTGAIVEVEVFSTCSSVLIAELKLEAMVKAQRAM